MEKQNNIRAIWLRLFALLAVFTGLAGCSEDEDKTNVSPEISLNKTNLVLEVGSSERLTASFNPPEAPNKGHIWTSSAANIATVDETGMVTAITVGNAVITAQALDGGKMASCNVQVVAEVVHVTGITLTPTNGDIAVGEQLQLTATVLPASATDKSVTWTSSNDAVATVDGTGKATGISAGSVVITATSNDGNKKATCQLTVREEGSEPVEIKTAFSPTDIYENKIILVSPAPTGVTSVKVCYGESPNPKVTDNIAIAYIEEDGLLHLTLDPGIKFGQIYYLRSYIEDGLNIIYNDDEVSVQSIGRGSDFECTTEQLRYERYISDLGITSYRAYWNATYEIKKPGTYKVTTNQGGTVDLNGYSGEDFYVTEGTGSFTYKREKGYLRYSGLNEYISFGISEYPAYMIMQDMETGIKYYLRFPAEYSIPKDY